MSSHDPETGCAWIMLLVGAGTILVWGSVWWFFGLPGVLALLFLSLAALTAINWIVWAAGRR